MFLWTRRMQLRQYCGKFYAGNIVHSTQNLQNVAKVILLPEKVFQNFIYTFRNQFTQPFVENLWQISTIFWLKIHKTLQKHTNFQKSNYPSKRSSGKVGCCCDNPHENFPREVNIFLLKTEYKYNHIMLRKFILLPLFLSVQRRHFWQNFRHFFDERPQIFGSESKKRWAEAETFQKLHFASMCCSWHVECSCNNPAETFALNIQKFLLNHRKKDPVFVEQDFFLKRFLWKNWLQLQPWFKNFSLDV